MVERSAGCVAQSRPPGGEPWRLSSRANRPGCRVIHNASGEPETAFRPSRELDSAGSIRLPEALSQLRAVAAGLGASARRRSWKPPGNWVNGRVTEPSRRAGSNDPSTENEVGHLTQSVWTPQNARGERIRSDSPPRRGHASPNHHRDCSNPLPSCCGDRNRSDYRRSRGCSCDHPHIYVNYSSYYDVWPDGDPGRPGHTTEPCW